MARLPIWLIVPLTIASCHDSLLPLGYFRPYFSAIMVGALICQPASPLHRLFESRPLAYVARISFALYVIHVFLLQGWFDEGDRLVRYLKRPLSIGLTFALAHLSTTRFEALFIRWSHRRTHPRADLAG